MDREITSINTYRDVLIKLIPSEIVATFMMIDGLLPPSNSNVKWLSLFSTLFLTALTPIYLTKIYGIKNKSQVLFNTGAFIVWVYWMGGPFNFWGYHDRVTGSVILILWTILVPLINLPRKHFLGKTIRVVSQKPNNVIRGKSITAWNPDMNQYLGRQAIITHINRRKKTVKIDIDNSEHIWSYSWFKSEAETNGGNDGSES